MQKLESTLSAPEKLVNKHNWDQIILDCYGQPVLTAAVDNH